MGSLLRQTVAPAEFTTSCPPQKIKSCQLVSWRQSVPKVPLPEFKPVRREDCQWMAPLLAAENSLSTDGCFGTFYLWGDSFGQTAARCEDRLLVRYDAVKEPFFAYPAGAGSLESALDVMERKAAKEGTDFLIKGVTEAQKEALDKERPAYFVFTESRDSADYIYEVEALASLAGRKLHGKRNHCRRFEENWPDWRFEKLQRIHFPQCLALLDQWAQDHAEKTVSVQAAERFAIERALKDYEALRLEGGVLFAGGKLVAFTIGERVGQNGMDIHFEKALAEFPGAYPMINREFVRCLQESDPTLRYVNREEDLGLENLRKAKESYRPAFLLKKYIARRSPEAQ